MSNSNSARVIERLFNRNRRALTFAKPDCNPRKHYSVSTDQGERKRNRNVEGSSLPVQLAANVSLSFIEREWIDDAND